MAMSILSSGIFLAYVVYGSIRRRRILRQFYQDGGVAENNNDDESHANPVDVEE